MEGRTEVFSLNLHLQLSYSFYKGEDPLNICTASIVMELGEVKLGFVIYL